ncbi:MAG TPA: DMT family transporter [Thermodesulfobacteriota bacterium]
MPASGRERAVGLLCAALVIVIWSSFIPVSRLGLSGALEPPDLVALRFAVAGLVTLPLLARKGTGGLGPRRALALALTAGIGFSVLAYRGLSLAPASHAAVLMPGVLPLWTACLAKLWLRTPLGRLTSIGLGLIAAGVAAMAAATLGGGPAGQWAGDLCFLGASLSWAVFTVAARAWQVPPLRAATLVAVISAAFVLPVYLLVLEPRLAAAPPGEVLFHAVYQGLVVTIVALVAFTRAVAALGPAPTAMITAAVPVAATLFAVPLLGERPSLVEIAGLALVTAGMLTAVVDAAGPTGRRARPTIRRPPAA